jgi:hypothetical protein
MNWRGGLKWKGFKVVLVDRSRLVLCKQEFARIYIFTHSL